MILRITVQYAYPWLRLEPARSQDVLLGKYITGDIFLSGLDKWFNVCNIADVREVVKQHSLPCTWSLRFDVQVGTLPLHFMSIVRVNPKQWADSDLMDTCPGKYQCRIAF